MLSGKKTGHKKATNYIIPHIQHFRKGKFQSRYQIRLPEFGIWAAFRLKGADVNFEGDEAEQLFYILIEMVVTQLCGFFKIH